MLARRLASAAVGIPLLLIVIVAGGRLYDALLAVVLAAAAFELSMNAGGHWTEPSVWPAPIGIAALAISAPFGYGVTSIVLTAFVLLWLLVLLIGHDAPRFHHWLLAGALFLYLGWLGRYLGLLRHLDRGRSWVLLAILVTFASETGAYAVGRLVGRHRLAPAISPGKTIEGAAGGLVGAGLAAVGLNLLLGLNDSPAAVAVLGLAIGVAAQAGDLVESALKRRLELKDAGFLVPGHGGLLDRLDSLLFAGAVVYYAVQWMSL
jgi:phosphatidate cytidylyltransferase